MGERGGWLGKWQGRVEMEPGLPMCAHMGRSEVAVSALIVALHLKWMGCGDAMIQFLVHLLGKSLVCKMVAQMRKSECQANVLFMAVNRKLGRGLREALCDGAYHWLRWVVICHSWQITSQQAPGG